MSYLKAIANSITDMIAENEKLHCDNAVMREELERYRTKEALEKLSMSPVTEVQTGTLDELMGEEEDEK